MISAERSLEIRYHSRSFGPYAEQKRDCITYIWRLDFSANSALQHEGIKRIVSCHLSTSELQLPALTPRSPRIAIIVVDKLKYRKCFAKPSQLKVFYLSHTHLAQSEPWAEGWVRLIYQFHNVISFLSFQASRVSSTLQRWENTTQIRPTFAAKQNRCAVWKGCTTLLNEKVKQLVGHFARCILYQALGSPMDPTRS